MSTSAASSSSFSPASSLSSAAPSWSSPLSHYHDLSYGPPMNQGKQPSSSRTPGPLPATPSIAALPSLAHSLSAFPTMTVVTNDMVHYGTFVRTKDANDKLNSALLVTRQRQGASAKTKPSATSYAAAHTRYPTPEDDDPVLLLIPKRSKAKRSS
ncbi:hypothetical protein L226DRAFT_525214 [Lentinus tigrinus ALCF2SS1-7]|uniref:Uncharacterized protein n=1 Tax=Lentinus tigrinus ALCF2SS1-6 TaxID=1328759 RepID=A0A5C2S014_9APHY|nr:hypothetical protein L227DRAFT_614325 [Lentinus tigrinus ALCF2SS1-6]RPD71594.1 hypothetical protein L226DRAFT_525214 [Lentinus tigrinus ALCF2SS1-7]